MSSILRKSVAVLALLVIPVSVVTAGPLKPPAGWVTDQHITKAIAYAKKKNRLIAFVYSNRETMKDGARASDARAYMRHRYCKGMVGVLVYLSARPPKDFQKVASQVSEPNEFYPRMYVATPDLRIIAFVQSGSHKKAVTKVLSYAKKAWRWVTKSKKDVEKAKKAVAKGSFGSAVKTYKRIGKEDAAMAIQAHRTWNVVVTEEEVDGFYFPEINSLIQEATAAANARYEKAESAFRDGKYKEARKLLAAMAKTRSELESEQKAVGLLKKVDEAIKKEKEEKKRES